MTLKEISLFYDGKAWAVFIRSPERNGKRIRGNPPETWYRIYQVEEKESRKVWHALGARVVNLNDQGIVPSKNNYRNIFPELSDLIS